MHVRCGHQIAHGSFERLVSHPLLYGSNIETGPQHRGSVRRAEGFQVEFSGIEPCTLSDGLASISAIYAGTGTSRSSQRFGKNPRLGLDVNRVVRSLRLTSLQNRKTISCSRKPVNRSVVNSSRARSSAAAKNGSPFGQLQPAESARRAHCTFGAGSLTACSDERLHVSSSCCSP